MNKQLMEMYRRIKAEGLSAEQEERILREVRFEGSHDCPPPPQKRSGPWLPAPAGLYLFNDLSAMQAMAPSGRSYTANIGSLDELLERDRQREEDGFPRKIRVGRMIRPGRGAEGKVVVVPTTVEEKFIHDSSFPEGEGEDESSGGTGEGEEGEIIGERPVRETGESGEGQAGQGEGGAHEVESSAYDLGRILTEKFQLPNLKEKGKKRSLTRYTYDLTDRNRGFGQVLDKKATLRRIIQTNIALGNIPDITDIDTSGFLIAPRDKTYRILSREKDYESQAMVFFIRDYSGSMAGKATELVATQHVLIYSWLLYQYDRQVETRFILHDTDAKEVPDFYTYYNSRVAGGTRVASAYTLVNELVNREDLARDYNIYVFQGTDGDDWDSSGEESIPELKKILTYASRVGVTVAQHVYASGGNTEVEKYLKNSGLLESSPELLRLDVMGEDAEEPRIIEGIRTLIS